MLWALSLVPPSDVVRVFENYVLQQIPEVDTGATQEAGSDVAEAVGVAV